MIAMISRMSGSPIFIDGSTREAIRNAANVNGTIILKIILAFLVALTAINCDTSKKEDQKMVDKIIVTTYILE